jgi:hypothetical protein
LAADLPLEEDTQLLRAITVDEIGSDGKIYSTAFSPRPERDKGMLSTEHESRPDGAEGYLAECGLDGVEGIYAVTVGECTSQDLPCLDDANEEGKSAWHVSIDFRNFIGSTNRLSEGGKRRARKLAAFAKDRGRLAPLPDDD